METIEERLTRLEAKLDATHASAEKTRKYILIMLTATIIMFILPLILGGLMFPFMMSTVGSMYGI